MKTSLRSLTSTCGLLLIGFVAGITVGGARSEHRPGSEQPGSDSTMLAQAAPSSPGALPERRGAVPGLDMNAVEKAIGQAAKVALDKAAAEAVDRIQKAALPAELTTLQQRIGELGRMRDEIRTQISDVRAKALQYALWGAVALFGVMVLASVLGGAIVAVLFRPRH
ncbi:MAG: hypothetical protein ISP45_16145 [Reyranella sp.]|jgi:hypothetical protein|nr:hypothetical protein [Reyranella sp.]